MMNRNFSMPTGRFKPTKAAMVLDQAHQEQTNDRAKLIMHRLVARELASDPDLLNRARDYHRARSVQMPGRDFNHDWEELLAIPVPDLRRRLTCRSEEMVRLRLSSPFTAVSSLGLDDIPLRRRIWRMARRMMELGSPASKDPHPRPGPR